MTDKLTYSLDVYKSLRFVDREIETRVPIFWGGSDRSSVSHSENRAKSESKSVSHTIGDIKRFVLFSRDYTQVCLFSFRKIFEPEIRSHSNISNW